MPALTIPVVTVVLTLGASYLVFGGKPLLDPKNVTLMGFGIGCIVALGVACVMTRDTVAVETPARFATSLSPAACVAAGRGDRRTAMSTPLGK